MKKNVLKLVLFALIFLAGAPLAMGQEVQVIKFKELQSLRNNPSDTLYVVNFWATWCKPCIKELPHFEAAHAKYKNQPVKVILVSLDSKVDLKTKVMPFAQKRNLKARLFLLDEPDANSWIDQVEPKWSGAIPATIFFNNRRQVYYFLEKELTEVELQTLIEKYKPINQIKP
jgi:thiol-disulfide isomerase/thioredoxin